MLLELSIKNFAIIDDLKINFTEGLNLLTGETGSGKSIIIEALGIVLGGRGSKDVIRTGEDKAILQALFFIEDSHRVKDTLTKYGIDLEENGLLIISREISNMYPSISRINGRTITGTKSYQYEKLCILTDALNQLLKPINRLRRGSLIVII